jgi:hypothetical protein
MLSDVMSLTPTAPLLPIFQMLRQKYPELIRQNQANRKPMQDFFNSINDGNKADKDKAFDTLLGKGRPSLDKRQGGVEDRSVQNPDVVPVKEKIDSKIRN